MATNKEFIVNKKFLIGFITFQIVIASVTAYALLSPKSVTVKVERLENSFTIERPLLNEPPKPSV